LALIKDETFKKLYVNEQAKKLIQTHIIYTVLRINMFDKEKKK